MAAKVCEILFEFDNDNDNKLNKPEARELYKNFAPDNQADFPMFKDWFKAVDKNDNNSLSRKELREYLYSIEIAKGKKFSKDEDEEDDEEEKPKKHKKHKHHKKKEDYGDEKEKKEEKKEADSDDEAKSEDQVIKVTGG